MNWKKYMAVFLAAGVGFATVCAGSPAEIFAKETGAAYEVNINGVSAADAEEDSGLGENGSGTGTTPGREDELADGESSGSELGETGEGVGTTPGGEGNLPGGDASGSDLSETDDGTGVTPGGEGNLPGGDASGSDLGETGDGTGVTPGEEGNLPSDKPSDGELGEAGDDSGTTPEEDNTTPDQPGTTNAGSGTTAGADSRKPGLPANTMPGTETIGVMKDSLGQNTGIMEQIEAAQQIITGNQESGYATRARQEKRSASGTGSSHYVRPGSYSVDAYAPQVGTIVASPVIKKEFRFWTVAKEAAIAKKKLPIREEMKSNSRTIGILPEDGVCYILKEEDGGWIYVESGTVRGFVRKELLISGLKATMLVETREIAATILGNMSDQTFSEEEILGVAEEKVPAEENAALTFRRATVYQTVVDKDPALAAWDVSIREEQSEEAREIGTLKKGGICYVITDRDQDWVYVESGDVRGFVKKEDLLFSDTKLNKEGKTLKDQIEERGESTYSLASELIPAEENKALYYSLMSIRSGIPGSSKREAVLSYAAQFIGNPYVWGGTDPVHGADCSGFVQTIYKQFGYTLPRVAAQQALSSEKIPVSEALPGDLIFYGNASGIYHVVIYAGGDQTIEAKGRKYGIVSSTLNQKAAVWAIRVMDDADALEYDIPEGLGTVHSYMGWQKVTNTRSQQYAFRKAAGMTFDQEGFAVVDNRYVIACTDTFGAIGDYVDFYQEDGTKIPCIIGDLKNKHDAGCNKWGHMNGQCIVEFVVDQTSWYPTHHANPGTASCHPEWHQDIVKAEKVGSFYE